MGRHELTDIAVLRINANTSFPTVVLGYNDQPEVGEVAVALGSPFGLDQTVTAGIVSAVSRIVNGVPMVQTDAAILSEILSDSPAEAVGLEIRDRIIAIDAQPINSPMQLFAEVVTRRPNTQVTIDYVRNDTQRQAQATMVGISG